MLQLQLRLLTVAITTTKIADGVVQLQLKLVMVLLLLVNLLTVLYQKLNLHAGAVDLGSSAVVGTLNSRSY